MSEKGFEISRRKALAGIGVVGVASAGAGLGTTAYFSDEEEFDGNTITAGEFSMTVTENGEMSSADQDGIGPDEPTGEMGLTGEDGAFYEGTIGIGDAKPGDEYDFCWDISLTENPGYVAVYADDVEHNDGSETDANLSAGDLFDTDDLETLEGNVNATVVVYDSDDNELSRLTYDDLGDLLDSLENGVPISDDDGDLIEVGDEGEITVCVELDIPTDVGNEIQGASTSADLIFYAEQSRHNGNFVDNLPSEPPTDDDNGS